MTNKGETLDFKEFCDRLNEDSFRGGKGHSRTDNYFSQERPGSTITPQARGHNVPDKYSDKVSDYKEKGKVVGRRLSSHGDPAKSAEAQDFKSDITALYLRLGTYMDSLTDKQRGAMHYTEHKTTVPLAIKRIVAATLRGMFGKAGTTLGPRNPTGQSADPFVYSSEVENMLELMNVEPDDEEKAALVASLEKRVANIQSMGETKAASDETIRLLDQFPGIIRTNDSGKLELSPDAGDKLWKLKKMQSYKLMTDTELFKDILAQYMLAVDRGAVDVSTANMIGPIVDYVWSRIDIAYGKKLGNKYGDGGNVIKMYEPKEKADLNAYKNAAKAILMSPNDAARAAQLMRLTNPDVESSQSNLLAYLEKNMSSVNKLELQASAEPEQAYAVGVDPEAALAQKKENRIERREAGTHATGQRDLKKSLGEFVTKYAATKTDPSKLTDAFMEEFPEVADYVKHGGADAYKYLLPDIARSLNRAIAAKDKVNTGGANYINAYNSALTELMFKLNDTVFRKKWAAK